MTVQTDYLALSWSTSRGRDTYGYNVARLDVRSTDRRFKCMGGGYDMIGTVLGEWMQATYQERLLALAVQGRLMPCNYHAPDWFKREDLYGLTFHMPTGAPEKNRAVLDGACGVSSMERIAEALGISLSRTYNRKGHTTGYMVTDYGSAEALQLAGRASS